MCSHRSRLIRQVLTGCCLLASVLAPATAQSDAAREAAREFRRFFRSFKETSQKVEAIYTLKGQESVEAADELVALLDHKEAEIGAAAMSVLTSYRETATFQGLIDTLADLKKQERRALLIEVLGKAKIAAALPVLVEIALHDRKATTQVKYAVARAVGDIGSTEGVDELLRAQLTDSEAVVRLAAIDSVARLRLQSVGPALVPLLHDDAWQVRSAAVIATGTVRVAEAVDDLIALLDAEGRVKEEAAEALFSITTLDFGANPEIWQKQWANLKQIGWRIPTDEEVAKAKAARQRNDAYYGKKETTTTFGGITTTSTNILFIIDVSGSMDDSVVDRKRFDAGYADLKKLTIVKTELARTIDGLDQNTNFNIVAFATDLKTWKKYGVPANIVNKASARQFVDRLKPIGGSEAQELAAAGLGGSANLQAGKTNTFKALMFPFGIDPEKEQVGPWSGEAAVKNKLDTVFFLSDGRPSTGKLVDTVEILKEVKRINETFRIVFHAIAIGEFQKNFLRGLAQENGGIFVDLGS